MQFRKQAVSSALHGHQMDVQLQSRGLGLRTVVLQCGASLAHYYYVLWVETMGK